MLTRLRILGFFLIGSWLAGSAAATEASAADPSAQPLFESPAALEVTLVADWRGLWRGRSESERNWEGELRYKEDNGDERTLPVRFSLRGLARLNKDVCTFTNLFLHFDPEQTQGTVFAAQESLPLVTYCRDLSSYQQYVIKEYLLYRVYNLLTDFSLRVRLARVTYEPTGRGKVFTGYAFFVENYHALARRLGGRVVEIKRFNPKAADPAQLGLLEVFQYFIGNTDWSVVHQHNIVLIRPQEDPVIAIPYDLDYAGAVNTKYAVADPSLEIPSVRTRVFRGFCRPEHPLEPVLEEFRARRPAIEALYREQPELDRRELRRALDYYADFWKVLDSEKLVRSKLVDPCRVIGTTK